MTPAEWLGLAACFVALVAVTYVTDLHDKERKRRGR